MPLWASCSLPTVSRSAGEAALDAAEELALEQALDHTGTVQGDEPCGARRIHVHVSREEILAHAARRRIRPFDSPVVPVAICSTCSQGRGRRRRLSARRHRSGFMTQAPRANGSAASMRELTQETQEGVSHRPIPFSSPMCQGSAKSLVGRCGGHPGRGETQAPTIRHTRVSVSLRGRALRRHNSSAILAFPVSGPGCGCHGLRHQPRFYGHFRVARRSEIRTAMLYIVQFEDKPDMGELRTSS